MPSSSLKSNLTEEVVSAVRVRVLLCTRSDALRPNQVRRGKIVKMKDVGSENAGSYGELVMVVVVMGEAEGP